MNRSIARWSSAALAVLAMGACEDTLAPDTFDQALLLDAAVVAADATLEDLGIMQGAFGFGHQRGPAPTDGMLGNGPRRPGGQRGIGGALSGTRELAFYDAANTPQDAYHELETARITAVVDVAGDIERTIWSATIARTRDMEITGLAGENTTRIISGSGTEDVSRSLILDDGETRSRDMVGSFIYTNLVVPTPDQEVRYPLSGTITRQMTVAVVNGRNGDVTMTVDVTITFDGSGTASGLINGEAFEIDLTAREGRFPLRRGFGRQFGG